MNIVDNNNNDDDDDGHRSIGILYVNSGELKRAERGYYSVYLGLKSALTSICIQKRCFNGS